MIGRRAFTLFELLIAITVSGILIGMTASWIHQTLQYSKRLRDRQDQHWKLDRLADELRRHVRHAQSMQLENENRLIVRKNQVDQIQFLIEDARITLEVSQSGAITRRESFDFSAGTGLKWSKDEMPEWVTLTVWRTPESLPAVAAGNVDQRWKGPPLLHVRTGPNRWNRAEDLEWGTPSGAAETGADSAASQLGGDR